jgi:hypothetical protein
MGIQLGTSVINRIFLRQNLQPATSSSLVGLISSSYSNGSTWTSTTGSSAVVFNSPLASGSVGRWQFNGSNEYIIISSSQLSSINQTQYANQQFTFLFYGTIGAISGSSNRRALLGSGGGGYSGGGDAILRTDSLPGNNRIHLDLRGPGGSTNRYNIAGESGSLLNLAITQTSDGTASVYQNGTLLATSGALALGYSPFKTGSNEAGAFIGYNNNTDASPYNGQLGAAYVYDRVLTPTEITQSSLSFLNSFNLVTASTVYLGSSLVYTQSSAPTPPTSMSVLTLVVAGGGSGGNGTGGGGGAGGVVYSSSLSLPTGIYAINVGSGGKAVGNNGGTSFSGSRGQDSSLVSGSTIVSASGGGGGKGYTYAIKSAANDGGSGGGASVNASNNDTPGTGSVGQGNNGGPGNAAGSNSACGGGGGGFSAAGGAAIGAYPTGTGGAGGNGGTFTIRAGSSVTYGGGGGGGGYAQSTVGGAGGTGGGTAGSNTSTNPTSASANTGGGGGGSWRSLDGSNNGISGNGGSGIIVIAYPTSSASNLTVSGGIVTQYTSGSLVYRSHTFLSSSNLVITEGTSSLIPTGGLQMYVNATLSSSYVSGSSIWYDLSGNGNNLTLSGSYTFTGSNSIYSNGNGWGRVTNSNNSTSPLNLLTTTSSITVIQFVKPITNPNTTLQFLGSKHQTGGNNQGWSFGYGNYQGTEDGKLFFDFNDANNGRTYIQTTNVYSNPGFYAVGMVYTGSAATVGTAAFRGYINGASGSIGFSQQTNTLGTNRSMATNARLFDSGRDSGIGGDGNPTAPFKGRIGAMLVYNRALSAQEMADVYNELSASFVD